MSTPTPEPGKYEILVSAKGRVDALIATELGVSRTKAASWITRDLVELDGTAVAKSAKVRVGQTLVVNVPDDPDPLEVRVEVVEDLRIIAEDPHYVVIDKPVGVAAHPSPGWVGPTVVGGIAALGIKIATSGAAERQGIVQRLDVGTSGIMVVAKTEVGYAGLKQAFRDRTPKKTYHALAQGLPDPLQGTIDAPIGRHPNHDWKFAVLEGGRNAITHYKTLEAFGKATLMEVDLETGRTHQIRVHFSGMNHPLAGDLTYGADPKLAAELGLTRQWLHAVELGFAHPVTGEWVQYHSPYPKDLEYALGVLGYDGLD